MELYQENKKFTVCFFGGTNSGNNLRYRGEAAVFGRMLANVGYSMIFGGGSTGIMGAAAREAIKNNAHVTSVIPRGMTDRSDTLDEAQGAHLIVSGNMHQRKEYMYTFSDAFVVFPGGIGTTDELIEVLTWKNLELHNKPIILVNIDGYWDFIFSSLQAMKEAGFFFNDTLKKLQTVSNVEEIFNALGSYKAPQSDKSFLGSASSLNLARHVQSHAASFGFDWRSKESAFKKVKEEFFELEEVLLSGERDLGKESEEIGDLLFSIINLIRHLGLKQDSILEEAVNKFNCRFDEMQRLIKRDGSSVEGEPSLSEMLKYWGLAKEAISVANKQA